MLIINGLIKCSKVVTSEMLAEVEHHSKVHTSVKSVKQNVMIICLHICLYKVGPKEG